MVITKQDVFDEAYIIAKDLGFDTEKSYELALSYSESHEEPEEVVGKKSYVISGTSTGNVIDMSFGYPAPDVEEELNILKMDYSGWQPPSEILKGDLEHFNHDLANGVRNDLDEKWHNFLTEASDWYIDDNGELRAKVTFPDNDLGREALTMYNTGQIGASIEYKGYKVGDEIKDWKIIGYSLTVDPSYKTKSTDKKSKGL